MSYSKLLFLLALANPYNPFVQNMDTVCYPLMPSCGLYSFVILSNDVLIPMTDDKVTKDHPSLKISSLKDIIKVANDYNINIIGVRSKIEPLLEKVSFPIIASVTPEHFVILRDYKNSIIHFTDNSGNKFRMTTEEFSEIYNNVALVFKEDPKIKDIEENVVICTKHADFGNIAKANKINYRFCGINFFSNPIIFILKVLVAGV